MYSLLGLASGEMEKKKQRCVCSAMRMGSLCSVMAVHHSFLRCWWPHVVLIRERSEGFRGFVVAAIIFGSATTGGCTYGSQHVEVKANSSQKGEIFLIDTSNSRALFSPATGGDWYMLCVVKGRSRQPVSARGNFRRELSRCPVSRRFPEIVTFPLSIVLCCWWCISSGRLRARAVHTKSPVSQILRSSCSP